MGSLLLPMRFVPTPRSSRTFCFSTSSSSQSLRMSCYERTRTRTIALTSYDQGWRTWLEDESNLRVNNNTNTNKKKNSQQLVLRLLAASAFVMAGFATPVSARAPHHLQPSEIMPQISSTNSALDESFWEDIEAPSGSIEEMVKTFLESNPDNIEALETLLFNRLEHKDVVKAMLIIDKILLLQPEELKWKHVKAQIHEARGEFDQAKKEYQEILHARPLSARALQGMVILMDREGESKEAMDLINTALVTAIQEGKTVNARNLKVLLGQFQTLKGNFEEALQLYDTLIEEDPKDFRPYLSQGLVYTMMGNTSKADEKFGKFRQLCPKGYVRESFSDNLLLKVKEEIRQANQNTQNERNKKKTRPMKQPLFFSSDRSHVDT